MASIRLTIDGRQVTAAADSSLLEAARAADIYIPALCFHPALPPANRLAPSPVVYRGGQRIDSDSPDATWDGCGICVVEVAGQPELVRACSTPAADGMVVDTCSQRVAERRGASLFALLAEHPHACLSCAQQDGCSRTQCSLNVPEGERCCQLLGSCELQRLAQFIGLPANLPRYRPRGRPVVTDEPLFDWNTELCVGCLRCVRACNHLRGVGTLSFAIRAGRPIVGTLEGPSRSGAHCRFCGACVEVCPTGALLDKAATAAGPREQTLVPCRSHCPAGVDIPRFIRHIAGGQFDQAIAVIREKLPFAFAPSYVCFRPCERACRRGALNQPIAVCQLKRFAADHDRGRWRARQKRLPDSGKRVAVVGAGPAGLTAAYYLARQGHAVTVLEALAQPGGMLRVGIPEFRYPRQLLQRDIQEVQAAGAAIRCRCPVSDPDHLERLAAEFDAVLLATGAHVAKRIELPGTELQGVHWGVEFLRRRALGQYRPDLFRGRQVVVVGGGNVAVDAARVARRLGTDQVRVVCLESPSELPAYDREVAEAIEEGISFMHRWGLERIDGRDGQVTGLVLKRCTRLFDDQGRFRPQYDPSERCSVSAQAVVLAIGQGPSSGPFTRCGLRPDGRVAADERTLATAMPGVWAAGDVVSGPASVIEAIAMGRRAAAEIDKALGGEGHIDETLADREPATQYLGRRHHFATLERAIPARLPAARRVGSFELIEASFDQEAAVHEAARCLACDLRLSLPAAVLAPRRDELLEMLPAVADALPEAEGVFTLLDQQRNVLAIKGVMNLRQAVRQALAENPLARWFRYELDPMYTKRESELIQQYLQQHGHLPGGGDDDLDDLF